MPFAENLDETQPSDLGALSQGDNWIRRLKTAINERMSTIVANWPDGALAVIVGAGAIGTGQIADNAITNAKMADDSVGSAELIDDSVQNVHIANDAVDTLQIADGAVTDAKIDGMDGSKLVDGSVTADKIDPGAFLSDIADGSVTNAKIADATIELAKLAVAAAAKIAETRSVVLGIAAGNQGSDTSTEVGSIAFVDAVIGDTVQIGFPNMDAWTAAQRTNNWYAFVNAAGNVKLRVNNSTGGNKDWPAGNFTLRITKPISDW